MVILSRNERLATTALIAIAESNNSIVIWIFLGNPVFKIKLSKSNFLPFRIFYYSRSSLGACRA